MGGFGQICLLSVSALVVCTVLTPFEYRDAARTSAAVVIVVALARVPRVLAHKSETDVSRSCCLSYSGGLNKKMAQSRFVFSLVVPFVGVPEP